LGAGGLVRMEDAALLLHEFRNFSLWRASPGSSDE
jgi:hypothetical protein